MKRFLLLSMAGLFVVFGFVSCKHSSKNSDSDLNFVRPCASLIMLLDYSQKVLDQDAINGFTFYIENQNASKAKGTLFDETTIKVYPYYTTLYYDDTLTKLGAKCDEYKNNKVGDAKGEQIVAIKFTENSNLCIMDSFGCDNRKIFTASTQKTTFKFSDFIEKRCIKYIKFQRTNDSVTLDFSEADDRIDDCLIPAVDFIDANFNLEDKSVTKVSVKIDDSVPAAKDFKELLNTQITYELWFQKVER